MVAGPGTGKTYNFRRVLSDSGGGLALTFIRALKRELERDLGDLAQVNTFHGYCKHLAHSLGGVEGLSVHFHYFPLLPELVAVDLAVIGHGNPKPKEIDSLFHVMDESNAILMASLEIGNYYDAVGHTDIVYRVQKHFAENSEAIPKHQVIVVDEYQDFNLLDTKLIETLADTSPIVIAGDDDQALYSFRDATSEFIRELASRDDVALFNLPYCSRCTEVVVEAVNKMVLEAQKRGNLAGRVDREYLCYLPEKAEDSDQHPRLIHAACTVENNRNPYMRRYIAEQIAQIPVKDVHASREKGHATALVIGPLHWVEPIYKFLEKDYTDIRFQHSEEIKMTLLDGYRLLSHDVKSRLGWRILLHVDPCDGMEEILKLIHADGVELSHVVPGGYKNRHLPLATLVERLQDGEELDDVEIAKLSAALEMNIDKIKEELADDARDEEWGEDPVDSESPVVTCTSFVGAKGLSAEHVFIVGLVNGVFPKKPEAITDNEVCKLIVGLSRTRKACHLVSCEMWAGPPSKKPSSFFKWLGDIAIEERRVNKDYWKSAAQLDVSTALHATGIAKIRL